MKLVSINVGLPREVQWHGKTVLTSIFKAPVAGLVKIGRLNLGGDRQSDPDAHRRADKAGYVYPARHHPFLRPAVPRRDPPPGTLRREPHAAGPMEGRCPRGLGGLLSQAPLGTGCVMSMLP